MKIVFQLVILILISSCTSNSQPASGLTPDQLNREFFNLYQSKGIEVSLKYLFSTNKWISEVDASNIKTKLTEHASQLGKYRSYEPIIKKTVGPSYVMYTFLIKYERQPVRFSITYYKPDTQWQLQIFEFEYDLQRELKEAATLYRLEENLPGNRN